MLARAQQTRASRLQPATAARLLGAVQAQTPTQDQCIERVASGLRLD